MPPLLLLFLLPTVSFAFLNSLFGNPCCQQPQQPVYQQPYYPQPQPQYYPQQPQYQQAPPQPQYYPQPQQGYVLPPSPRPQPHFRPQPIYRNPLRQHAIPESAYGSPPGYKPAVTRPSLSRSGYGDNEFLGEGSISVRPSAEGERATYIMNRHGANSLIVHDESIRTLAPPESISQPMVDEVVVEANAPARQSVQVISQSQPVHPVEKLYRPTVHEVDIVPEQSVDPIPTYTAPTPTYTPAPAYEAPHVIEATSEFRGVEPVTPSRPLSYPIEQQGYDSATEAPITPYEPVTYTPPVQVQPSTGYDGVKRMAGFEHEYQLRAVGLARRSAV